MMAGRFLSFNISCSQYSFNKNIQELELASSCTEGKKKAMFCFYKELFLQIRSTPA